MTWTVVSKIKTFKYGFMLKAMPPQMNTVNN